MLDHNNSNYHTKHIVLDILSIGLSHMKDIALQLKKLDINDLNINNKSPDIVEHAILLNKILTILNDVLHPAYNLAKELYPTEKDFIELYQKNHSKAIERKLLASNCHCYACNTKNSV